MNVSAHLRGRILVPVARSFMFLEDGLLRIQSGRVMSVESAPEDCTVPETHPGCVLIPAFTDSHLHYPQTRIVGSASGTLLTWLQQSTFPEESRFANTPYAEQVAQEFCQAVLRSGVSAVAAYSSSHFSATNVLFSALQKSGLKGLAGMVLMNREAPESLLVEVASAEAQMEQLIATWHGVDSHRLRYCVTPRFAISCTAEMLKMAGELADRHELWVQSHVSENVDEVAFTQHLFPDSDGYLQLYRDFGLLHERSIYAHCIHFSQADWQLFANSQAVVAHCPDSNFFLGSGCMQYQAARDAGARLSIGSDVGAGRSFSMRLAAGRAYDASLMVGNPVLPEEILWTATIGGSIALGFNRSWQEQGDADLCAIACPPGLTKAQLLDHIIFRHDEPHVRATYVRGQICYASE